MKEDIQFGLVKMGVILLILLILIAAGIWMWMLIGIYNWRYLPPDQMEELVRRLGFQ